MGFVIRIIHLPGFDIFYSMSLYLLIGYFFAGLVKFIIPEKKIYNNLSDKKFSDVLKAAFFGVPIPVCSCGVIPLVEHLRRSGASKKATISFLISTPTTGLDSILATYSLLGPVFAIFRPLSSFLGGILGGLLVKIFIKEGEKSDVEKCKIEEVEKETFKEKIISSLKYSFFELVESTGKWILLGVLLGTLISFVVPESFFRNYFSNRFLSYILMMLAGIPLYVCATGSIPVAASLVIKGLSPGAALVFLITGPATNSATILFVLKKLGKKTLFIYLISIVIISLFSGFLLDLVIGDFNLKESIFMHKHSDGINIFKLLSSLILALLILKPYVTKMWRKKMEGYKIKVKDIMCSHCANTIEKGLMRVKGVKRVFVDVEKKEVYVEGDFELSEVFNAIKDAGYSPE
ncbi:MAG: permease [bacterium]|nr:permease [bacterium]